MEQPDNIIQQKTYQFAIRVVRLYKYLIEKKGERVLSKQLLRSGTSIGANTEEAQGAHSKADFISKFTIAYKEARETKYWVRLLRDTDYISVKEAESILTDLDEILRIISKIQTTTKQNNKK